MSSAFDPETAVPAPWRPAFRSVRREWFVPDFYLPHPDRAGWQRISAPSETWRAGVDSDRALVTQVGGGSPGDDVRGLATSSTSAPPLMAAMLDALDIDGTHRVLELGTGTGYNAGLLTHRLGPHNVSSVEVDPGLVDLARRRLHDHGLFPHLRVGDAADGCPERAPFDRILATVALPAVPGAWFDQLAPGGTVLLPLDRHGAGGLLALFERESAHLLRGRLLDARGYFMATRSHGGADPFDVLSGVDDSQAVTRTTCVPVDETTAAGGAAEHFVALHTGGFGQVDVMPTGTGTPQRWLTRPDGAWARLTLGPGATTVAQGGPCHLWDAVERAHERWTGLGRPDHGAVELVATPDGLTIDDGRPRHPASG
jgi:protein-L-isoaspartate O-methyltransferase